MSPVPRPHWKKRREGKPLWQRLVYALVYVFSLIAGGRIMPGASAKAPQFIRPLFQRIRTQEASAAETAEMVQAGIPSEPIAVKTHAIASEESLWEIAEMEYGSGEKWIDIWQANRSDISDKTLIQEGAALIVPAMELHALPIVETAVKENLPQMPSERQGEIVKQGEAIITSLDELMHAPNVAASVREEIESDVLKASIAVNQLKTTETVPAAVDSVVGVLDAARNAIQITSFFNASGELTNPLTTITTQQIIATSTLVAGNQILSQGVGSSITSNGFQALTTEQIQETAINAVHKVAEVISPVMDTSAISVSAVVQQVEEAQEATTKALQNGNVPLATSSAAEAVTNAIVAGAALMNDASTENAVSAAVETLSALNVAAVSVIPAVESVTAAAETSHVNKTVLTDPVIEVITRVVTSVMTLVTPGLALSTAESANAPTADGLQNAIWTGVEAALQKLQAENNLPTFTSAVSNASSTAATLPAAAVMAAEASQASASATQQAVAEIENSVDLSAWARSIGVSNLWKRYEKSGTVASGEESFDGFVSYLRSEGYKAMADMVTARAPGTESVVSQVAKPAPVAATAAIETASSGAVAASSAAQTAAPLTSQEERDSLKKWANSIGVSNLWKRYEKSGIVAPGNESFDGFVSYLRGEGYKAMVDMVLARAPGTEKVIQASVTPTVAAAAVESVAKAAANAPVQQVIQQTSAEERSRLVSWAKNLGVINLWNRYAGTGTALGNENFDGFVSYLRGEGYKAMADMVVARAPGTEKKIETKEAAVEEKGPAATQQAVSQVTETPTVETQATVSAGVAGTASAEAPVQEAVLPVLTETPAVETQTPLSAEAVEAPSTEAAPVQEAQSGSAMAAAAVEEAKQTIDTLASEANAQSLELQSQTFSEENIKKALENIPSLIEGAEAAVKTAETALESAPESAETQALVDAANTSLGIAKGLVEEAKEASTIGDDTAAASKISQTIETVNEAIGKAGETVEAADAAVAGEAEVAAAATEAFSQIVSGQIEAEPVASVPGVAPAASKVQKVPTIQLGEAPDLALTSRLTGALSKAVRKVTVAETSKAEYAPIQLIDGGQNVIKALTAIAGSSADGRVGDQIKEIISLLSKDKISASEIDSLTGRTAEVQQAIAEEASAGKISFDEANEFQDILDQNLIILENAISKNQKKEAIATLSLGIAAIAQKTSDPAIVSALGAAPTKSAFDEMGLVVSPTGSGGKGTLMETSNPELASLGRQVNLNVRETEADARDVSVENVLAAPEFQKELSQGAKTPDGLAFETLHNTLAVISNEEVLDRLTSAGKLSAGDLNEVQNVKAGIAELTQESSNFGGVAANVPDASEGSASTPNVTDQSLSRNNPELAAKILGFLEHPVTVAVSAFIPGATVARFAAATAIKTDLADQLREGKIAAEGAALMSFGDSSTDSPFSNIASGSGTEVSPITQADMTIREVKGVDEATKAVHGAITNAQIIISSMKERGLDTSIAEMQLAQVKSDPQSIAEAELDGTIPDLLNEIKDIIADVSATNSGSLLTPEAFENVKPGVLSGLGDKISFEETAKSLKGPSEKDLKAIHQLEMKGIAEQVNNIASQISGRAASIQLSELTVQNAAAKDSTTKADAEAAVKAAREAVIIAQQTLNDATVAVMLSGSESAQNDLYDLDITAAIAESRAGAAENRLKTGEYLGAIASSKSAVQSAALVVTNSQIAVTTAQNSLQENKNAVIDMSGPDTRTRAMTQNVSGDSLGSAGSLGELSPSGVGALPSSVVAMTQLSDLQSSVNQLSGSANKLALQLNNELKLSNPDLMVVSSLVNQIISKAEITNQLINDGKGQLGIAGDAGNLQLSNAKQSAEKAGLALLKIDRKETEKAVQDALQSIKVASDTITKNSDKVAKQLQAEGEALTQTQTPEQEAAAIQSEIQVALQKQEEVKIQTIVSAVNSATAFEQSADNAAAKVTEAFAAKNATEAVHSALSGAKAALSAADAALTVTIITGSESGEAQARSARTAAIEAKERAEAAADALSDGQEKDALLFAYESGEKTAESAALSRVAVADATPRGIAVGGGATTRSMNGESSGSSDSSAAATAAIIAAENAANELAKAANPETNAEFSDFGQSGELPLASGSFESATAVAGGKASVSLEDALHNLEVAKANGVSGEELSAFYDQVASALKQATENEAAAANGDAASIVGELENKAQPAATGEVRAEAAARVEELETEMRNAIHAGNYGAALSYLSAANRASIQANQETVAPVPVASNVDPFGGLGGLDNAGSDTTGNTDTVSDGTLSDFGASGNLPSTAIQDTVVAAPGVQADFDTGTADVVPSSTGADFDYSGGDVYVPSNSDFDFSGGDVYVPPPPPPSPSHDARFSDFGSSGGGGGGGGGTGVICTTLHEYGWMDEKMWGADEAYGRLLSPVVRDGYHLWAVPLAHMMRKSVLVRGAVGTIAMFWAKEMAYQMGARSRGSLFGKLLMSAGIVICHRLGKARRLAARTSLVPVNSEAAAKNY